LNNGTSINLEKENLPDPEDLEGFLNYSSTNPG
jgi:hypothetical protein